MASFPPPHIVEPTTSHTHTVILLHGRASEGPEFADELFSSNSSNNESLKARFPSWRWVFPSSRNRWSLVFQEELTAWFDVYSLADPCEQQDLQVDGLRESTLYILSVLQREIDLLAGDSEKLVFGGISQGMAIALWVFLSTAGKTKGRIGAFVGMSGWFPFANKAEDLLRAGRDVPAGITIHPSLAVATERGLTLAKLVLDIVGCQGIQINTTDIERLISTPTLLLHGTDDAWVDVELGRQSHKILVQMGMEVDWNEYSGAENEGHWIKEPEGFDTLVAFLENQIFGK